MNLYYLITHSLNNYIYILYKRTPFSIHNRIHKNLDFKKYYFKISMKKILMKSASKMISRLKL